MLAEAAANDGLAYPFLAISIYLTVETSVKTAIGKWFLVGWLCLYYWVSTLRKVLNIFITDQVILGAVLGAVLGRRCPLIFWINVSDYIASMIQDICSPS